MRVHMHVQDTTVTGPGRKSRGFEPACKLRIEYITVCASATDILHVTGGQITDSSHASGAARTSSRKL